MRSHPYEIAEMTKKKQSLLLDLEYHGVNCSLTEIVILGERGTSVWGALPRGIANAWETIQA